MVLMLESCEADGVIGCIYCNGSYEETVEGKLQLTSWRDERWRKWKVKPGWVEIQKRKVKVDKPKRAGRRRVERRKRKIGEFLGSQVLFEVLSETGSSRCNL